MNTLKLRPYNVVMDAVERGIEWGLALADKDATNPLTNEQVARLRDHLAIEIGNALCEVVNFDE